MVNINKVFYEGGSVTIEFLTNGITISAIIYQTKGMTPDEIVSSAYGEIKSLVETECNKLGFTADHELPKIENKILNIRLDGVSDVTFNEGQDAIVREYKCIVTTLFGEEYAVGAEFNPSNIEAITATDSESRIVRVAYNGFIDVKGYEVIFIPSDVVKKEEI